MNYHQRKNKHATEPRPVTPNSCQTPTKDLIGQPAEHPDNAASSPLDEAAHNGTAASPSPGLNHVAYSGTYYLQPQKPDRSQLFVVPLKNSTALRMPAFGGTGGQSGAFVDPVSNVIILTESSNEKKLVKSLLADRQVKTVKEQATIIPFIGLDGKQHHHTIDFIAERHDQENIGYLVKDEHGAAKKGYWDFAANLASQTPRSTANRIQVATSRNMPEWHVQNAGLIVNVRRENRSYIDDELRAIAPSLTAPVRIGELSRRLGGGATAFRPIVRALYYGTLKYLGWGKIDLNTKVIFSGAVMEDTDCLGPVVDPAQLEPPVFRKPKKAKLKKPRASRRAS